MTPAAEPRRDTRRMILNAATEVVRSRGPAALTIEAAAEAAGVSKGGLLYHFPTKDALIESMVEDVLARFESDVDAAAGMEPPGQGQWLRAFVKTTFAADPEHDLSAGLLAAAAVNPDLLAPVGTYFARWQERAVADGLDARLATLVRLASDGLWFADLFDVARLDDRSRGALLMTLLELIVSGESLESSEVE